MNTRLRLRELEAGLGRPATLDDMPDAELDHIAAQGFDWLYCLGVWSTGEAGRQVSRSNPDWRRDSRRCCPTSRSATSAGRASPSPPMRRTRRWAAIRRWSGCGERLHARGLRLMLDFVPNHMAPDHPWARDRPELFVRGSQAPLAREPGNYAAVETAAGPAVLAHGRDPYFPGWPDTLQLDYGNPARRRRCAASCSPPPRSAMACAATWRC